MKKIVTTILLSALFVGCASVKMESKDASDKLKQFAPPSIGNSGLYLYRDGSLGAALKRTYWLMANVLANRLLTSSFIPRWREEKCM